MSIQQQARSSASSRHRGRWFPIGFALLVVSACSSGGESATNLPGSSAAGGGASGAPTAQAGSGLGGAANHAGSASGGTQATAGAAGAVATGGASNAGGGNNAGASNAGQAGTSTAGAGNAGSGSAGASGMAGAGGSTVSYNPCPTDSNPCKVMPFGDSITDGYGVQGGYRIELFTSAHQAGKKITFVGSGQNGPSMVDGVAFPQHHEGHSGFTIDPTPSRSGISPLVATVMPSYTPHIVTLMIGTNDAIDDYEMGNAPTRLGKLIDSIIGALPNALVIVAQIIPSQDDALNGRIQTYNAAIPAVVQARSNAGKHLLLVNMYPALASNPNYKTALLNDTWHPNAAGYAQMAQVWYGALGPLLH